ncbi:nicotinamide-nucleotide amidohydrolase family protein [Mycetocola manganoxydans]|uniref:Nicotinamide-nucleotide amidohydrolase family protein n=1 Tax=Mycetocola manganoxydans TaxID=699879 RepID=A0A3L6ZQB4_9MICO|nr:nicotinamide-nucleotide amidohydrolase family protein [Mycetocola manganoxydans]RLP69771.1 nicotinamide-nucleotide amidohydrolase family protein [Mycetocola manganoxydans]GHD49977.1 competence protein [Mycetocola manganoxydans]
MTSAGGREADRTAALIRHLTARGLTLGVAESLTGGLLAAELIRPAGASAVVRGGVVAYATEVKASVLGVNRDLLAEHGPVHPQVAEQMAAGVRRVLSVDGREADIGISTTGVAGPDPQAGKQPGTVYLGLSMAGGTRSIGLTLSGTRDAIRRDTVTSAIDYLLAITGAGSGSA